MDVHVFIQIEDQEIHTLPGYAHVQCHVFAQEKSFQSHKEMCSFYTLSVTVTCLNVYTCVYSLNMIWETCNSIIWSIRHIVDPSVVPGEIYSLLSVAPLPMLLIMTRLIHNHLHTISSPLTLLCTVPCYHVQLANAVLGR